MAITIVPHDERWKPGVEAFNARMRDGGQEYGFYVHPVPRWIPRIHPSQPAWREFYLAVEDQKDVRGAYAIKPQAWWIRGQLHTVTDWQGPFSEGVVSKRYGMVGVRMVRDMQRRRPLLYSWGHGGADSGLYKLLASLEWAMHPTPFLLRIVRPFRFARKNRYLREDRTKRVALDVLAWTGLASIGGRVLEAALSLGAGTRLEHEVEVVSEFGAWADAIWARARHDYAALAVRDARAMNTLLPRGHGHEEWSAPVRLRVQRRGVDLGWAVVCLREMDDHRRFGALRVGTIVDALACAEWAREIVHAASEWLARAGADIVIANQSDPRWIRAFQAAAFLRLENRRAFCAAPAMLDALAPWEDTKQRLFLTNLDGHGPMGL